MSISETKDVIVGRYSLTEYLDLLKSDSVRYEGNLRRLKNWRQSQVGEASWHGLSKDARADEGATDATMRLISDGWKRGVDLMQEVSNSLDCPTPVSIRRRSVWSDQGDDVEMQRVWSGNIDRAWRRVTKASGVGPRRVRILVDSIASGAVDSETMRWRGVAAMKLADLLVDAGYAVQVESVFVGEDSPKNFHLDVVVKSYTDPLDITSLAATTALPAFFRALGHDWHFYAANEATSAGYGVGRAKAEKFADEDDTDAEVFLAPQSIENATGAANWVTACINKLDAEAHGE